MRLRLDSLLIICLMLGTATATAATKEEERVAVATDVLDRFLRIPEQSIPPSLLGRAYAVAVVPNVVNAGFVIGARHGKGILVIRQPDNSWSNPAFIKLTGGSFGWQAGAQSTDIILVFKNRRGVDGISNGKLTLGGNASVAAGPVGRHTGIATDLRFQSEVFSYSRSRGLFAGVALQGSSIRMDRHSNAAFYGSSSITPEQIFSATGNAAPAVANDFVQVLTAQTRRLPKQPAMESGIAATNATAKPKPKVRTYGIGDPEEGEFDEAEVAREY